MLLEVAHLVVQPVEAVAHHGLVGGPGLEGALGDRGVVPGGTASGEEQPADRRGDADEEGDEQRERRADVHEPQDAEPTDRTGQARPVGAWR